MRRPGPFDGAPLRVLLRHADAGVRAEWHAPDDWRGLTALGRVQADRVVARVEGLPLLRVMSSPSLRCRQTVVPLARYLGLDIEPRPELTADVGADRLLRFLADRETEFAVLCTHRETLETLFAALAAGGAVGSWTAASTAADRGMEKAAAWVVRGTVDDRTSLRVEYLPVREPTRAGRWRTIEGTRAGGYRTTASTAGGTSDIDAEGGSRLSPLS